MKKLLNYKEYIPFVALLMYTYGYTFEKVFYSNFGIGIEYYVSFSDLIFFTINFLVYLGFLLLVTEIILIIFTYFFFSFLLNFWYRKRKIKYESSDKYFEIEVQKRIDDNYNDLTLLTLTLAFFVLMYFTKEYVYSFSIFFTLFTIKLYKMVTKYNKTEIEKDGNPIRDAFVVMFLVIVLIVIVGFSLKEAFHLKETKNGGSKEIQFCENDVEYSTKNQKSLVYIGETSGYIFLYDQVQKKSLIFNKNSLDNISISDPTVLTEDDEKDLKHFKRKVDNYFKNSNSR